MFRISVVLLWSYGPRTDGLLVFGYLGVILGISSPIVAEALAFKRGIINACDSSIFSCHNRGELPISFYYSEFFFYGSI